MASKKDDGQRIFASNRAARHNFHIDERLEAGLALTGPEVKSVREGKVVLKDAFASVKNGEVFLHRVHITPYSYATHIPQDPERSRKLLLHRREILKLTKQTTQEGYTLVPLRLYLKNGVIKVEIGVAKGKKQYDKRDSQKKESARRDIEAALARRQKGR